MTSQPPEGPVFELTTRRATPAVIEDDEEPDEDGWDVPETKPGRRRPPPLPSDAPEISIGVADADPDLPEVDPPSSEMVHATARAPHKRYSSDELRLPKVIVNVDNDLEKLVDKSKDFSGAEIEAAVKDGVLEAFIDGDRPAETRDILKAVEGITPTAQMMSEKIEEIRKWARNNIKGAAGRTGSQAIGGNRGDRVYEF